jgi:hypothetical protein
MQEREERGNHYEYNKAQQKPSLARSKPEATTDNQVQDSCAPPHVKIWPVQASPIQLQLAKASSANHWASGELSGQGGQAIIGPRVPYFRVLAAGGGHGIERQRCRRNARTDGLHWI